MALKCWHAGMSTVSFTNAALGKMQDWGPHLDSRYIFIAFWRMALARQQFLNRMTGFIGLHWTGWIAKKLQILL